MLMQLQPNQWSCLPTAFAMVLDIPLKEVIFYLGHDGSEIVPEWSHLQEPYNRKGFHIQELILLAHTMGYSVTPFEPRPTSISSDPRVMYLLTGREEKFAEILKGSVGVITGVSNWGARHAMAWNLEKPIDPSGKMTTIDDFQIQCFWRVIKSENVL